MRFDIHGRSGQLVERCFRLSLWLLEARNTFEFRHVIASPFLLHLIVLLTLSVEHAEALRLVGGPRSDS